MFKKLLPIYGLVLTCAFPVIAGAEQSTAADHCDVSFEQQPVFPVSMTTFESAEGDFIVRNYTRRPIALTGINLEVDRSVDTLPTNAAFRDTRVVGNCGAFIPAKGVCTVRIVLNPLTAGQFSRTLRIGVNTRQCNLSSKIISTVVTPTLEPAFPTGGTGGGGTGGGGTPTPFFQCLILSKAVLANSGASIVRGGVCSDANITGFSSFNDPGTEPGFAFNKEVNNVISQTEFANATSQSESIRDLCANNFPLMGDITGNFSSANSPAVFCFAGNPTLRGRVTFSGPGPFYFVTQNGLIIEEGANFNPNGIASRAFISTSGQTTIENNVTIRGIFFSDQANLKIGEGVVLVGAIRAIGANTNIEQISASAP